LTEFQEPVLIYSRIRSLRYRNLTVMRKRKLPYVLRFIRYALKCMWYYVLFPIRYDEPEN